MRFDGGTTVPGDWVPFVLMSVSLGKGLYRLFCFHSNRSGLTWERKKEKKVLVQYSMGRGTINDGCNDCAVF